MRSKLLKSQIKYLVASIDSDIANENRYLDYMVKHIEDVGDMYGNDAYNKKQVAKTKNKILFLQDLRFRVSNFHNP